MSRLPNLLRPMRFLPFLLAVAVLPARAGVFDADAMRAVTTLRQEHDVRLERLEQAAQNQLDLANRIEGLDAEVARLRGQVEVLNFQLGQAQKRLQDYYVDLDSRMRKLETTQTLAPPVATGGEPSAGSTDPAQVPPAGSVQSPAGPVVAAAAVPAAGATVGQAGTNGALQSAPPVAVQPAVLQPAPVQAALVKSDPEAETRDFEAGLDYFKNNKFKEAAAAFSAFLQKHPSSSFGASACYWGGNAHFQLRQWAKAVEFYGMVVRKWPEDPKAPDALLQLSEAQAQSGDAKSARATLDELVARYPESPAAGTGRQRLAKKKGN